ncbi:MAG TPA: glycosyltransferase [Euzebyales bacterium]
MERTRYAVFAPNMAGGGAERAAVQLASGLAQRGFHTDLVLASADGPRMAEVPDTVDVVDLRARRVLTSVPALVRYLRRTRPAAMASVLDHANVAALVAARLAGSPTRLVVVEQNNLSSAAGNGKSRRDRMMPRFVGRFYPWAHCVAGVSAGVIDDLRSLINTVPDERYRVIHNPIVTPELIAKAQAPAAHRWFDRDEPVFVAAGRLRPQKDFPTLIDAFHRVRSTRHARLMILGEGPDRTALEAQIRRLGLDDDVELHGYTDNPYRFFARATAFVLSSRWEGLPTVLIEALSCGAPVVATDCPNGPDEILAGGRYGRLVPVGDTAAIAAGLEAALDGELSRPPEHSWRPYTVDAVVDDYLDAFAGS